MSKQSMQQLDVVSGLRMFADERCGTARMYMLMAAREIERLRALVAEDKKKCQGNCASNCKAIRVSTGVTGNQWFTIPPPPRKDTATDATKGSNGGHVTSADVRSTEYAELGRDEEGDTGKAT